MASTAELNIYKMIINNISHFSREIGYRTIFSTAHNEAVNSTPRDVVQFYRRKYGLIYEDNSLTIDLGKWITLIDANISSISELRAADGGARRLLLSISNSDQLANAILMYLDKVFLANFSTYTALYKVLIDDFTQTPSMTLSIRKLQFYGTMSIYLKKRIDASALEDEDKVYYSSSNYLRNLFTSINDAKKLLCLKEDLINSLNLPILYESSLIKTV